MGKQIFFGQKVAQTDRTVTVTAENLKVSEVTAVAMALAATATEALHATESASGELSLLLGSASENVKITDTISASFGLSTTLTNEALKIVDSVTPAMSLSAVVTEGLKVVDTALTTAFHLAISVVSAGIICADGPPSASRIDPVAGLIASVSENVKLDESGHNRVTLTGALHITDGPALAELGTAQMAVNKTETVKLSESLTAQLSLLRISVTAEGLKPADTTPVVSGTLLASLTESVKGADAYESYAELGKDDYLLLADQASATMGGFELLERSVTESVKLTEATSVALSRSVVVTAEAAKLSESLFASRLDTGALSTGIFETARVSDDATPALTPLEASVSEAVLVVEDLTPVRSNVEELFASAQEGLRPIEQTDAGVDLRASVAESLHLNDGRTPLASSVDIVFYEGPLIKAINSSGGGTVTLATVAAGRDLEHVAVSPDRSRLVANYRIGAGQSRVMVIDLMTGVQTDLLPGFYMAGNGGVDWDHNGFIYFSAIDALPFPGTSVPAELILNGAAENIWRVKYDGTSPQQLTSTTDRAEADVAVSQDGSMLTYVVTILEEPPHTEIWVANINGSSPQQVYVGGVSGVESAHDPELSPDNSQVVFSKVNPLFFNFPAGPNTAHDIYKINVNGTGLTLLTTPGPISIIPDWKGSKIVFLELDDDTVDYLGAVTIDDTGANYSRIYSGASTPKWIPDADAQLLSASLSSGILSASVAEGVKISDAVSAIRDHSVAVADSLRVSDAVSVEMERAVSLAESARITEALFAARVEAGELVAAGLEPVAVVDSVTATLNALETAPADGVLVTDAVLAVLSAVNEQTVSIQEASHITEVLAVRLDLTVSVQEGLAVADVVDTSIPMLEAAPSEGVRITESMTVRGITRRSIIRGTGSHVPRIYGTGSSDSVEG